MALPTETTKQSTPDQWYYHDGSQVQGPLSARQLADLACRGSLRPDHRVMKGSDGKWHLASQVKGLRFAPPAQPLGAVEAVAASPPPLPAQEPITHPLDPPDSALGAPKSAAEMIQPAPATIIQDPSTIITCPECGEQIKHAVKACPGCGYPIEPSSEAGSQPVQPVIILEERPVDRDQVSPLPAQQHAHATDALGVAKAQAGEILNDLRNIDFRNEIVPLDESNLPTLWKDSIFWFATLLGIVPLMIGTLATIDAQVIAFAFFFASVWGVIFRSSIVKDDSSLWVLLASMLFTGIIGSTIAAHVEPWFLPPDFPEREGYLSSLLKYIFVVGLCEELCKVAPVFVYLRWKQTAARPMTIVLVGVFSGLGFAAFENVGYIQLAIQQTVIATQAAGIQGLVVGVEGAVVNGMLRALSLVFCHAVWTGIFAYFFASASLSRRRRGAFFVVGLVLTIVLHGCYDWLQLMQPTLAALMAGLSFILFYGYVAKLRKAIATSNKSDLSAATVVPGVVTG